MKKSLAINLTYLLNPLRIHFNTATRTTFIYTYILTFFLRIRNLNRRFSTAYLVWFGMIGLDWIVEYAFSILSYFSDFLG